MDSRMLCEQLARPWDSEHYRPKIFPLFAVKAVRWRIADTTLRNSHTNSSPSETKPSTERVSQKVLYDFDELAL
jgi:hypothetical protein